ncbi:18S rRNA maturation protein [Neocucurbitaria cava]|uniref:rRNA-processing protein EFG1 n=1 Tax=Neocucurbitaria cava TaxID=798079 RepID=A0A9W9CH36_9PLEO|nr:18S rRNA maturation protein [Neocucurbitaria cava]
MSQKRKHAEFADIEPSNPKPFKKHRSFNPGDSHQKSKRPQVSNDISKTTSTNALKSRIRDLKRLLAHVENVEGHKMSAGMRIERERELEACEHELREQVESKREAEYRQKMIGKYHQVRFFDRQKATRILKKLKKELSTSEDQSQKTKLNQRIHNAEVDVNYAIYYPLMKPYPSLYPKSKKGKSAEADDEDDGANDKGNREVDGPKGDAEMWRAIEKAMAEGTLNALRYSKDGMPAAPATKELKKFVKKPAMKREEAPEGMNRRERRKAGLAKAQAAQDEDQDSDGGFFE